MATDDMLSWLRSTIEGDKAAAEKAQPGPWHIGNAVDPTRPCNVHTFPGASGVADNLRWLDAEHVVRQNPRDTIVRCTAELRVLNQLAAVLIAPEAFDRGVVALAEELVRRLVGSYQHRPGFNPDWVSD